MSIVNVQPANQEEAGTFDSIIRSVIAGIRVYRSDNAAANTAALERSAAGGRPGTSSQTLLIIGVVVIGLYLALEK